jgi:hypothetical protein
MYNSIRTAHSMHNMHFCNSYELPHRGGGGGRVTAELRWFFYVFHEHGSDFAQKASIHRGNPCQLPRSEKQQQETSWVPKTGVFDSHLSLVNTWYFVGMMYLNKHWPSVEFPQTVGMDRTWEVTFVGITTSVDSLYNVQCTGATQKQLSRERGFGMPP